jgi:alpha-glucosidase
MIQLKKNNEVFTYGTYDLILADHPQIYAYTRMLNNDKVVVMSNLSDKMAMWDDDLDILTRPAELLLANYDHEGYDLKSALTLKPFETRVYRL